MAKANRLPGLAMQSSSMWNLVPRKWDEPQSNGDSLSCPLLKCPHNAGWLSQTPFFSAHSTRIPASFTTRVHLTISFRM